MSDIELAITTSKRLESLLAKHFKATGKGLHEKLDSVGGKLPDDLVRRMRFIATVRNKIVHDDDYERIDDRKRFIDAGTSATAELRKLAGIREGSLWKWIVPTILILAAAAFLFFKFRK